MHSQDYIITQAFMPTAEPKVSTAGTYDKAGTALVPRRVPNPLGCTQYKVQARPPLSAIAEDPRKAERAAIIAALPVNDNEIFPRTRNGGGEHAYLRQFTAVLSFWRRMSNPPAELGSWAANDNTSAGLNAENEQDYANGDFVSGGNPRPMAAESLLAMLPVPTRVSVRTHRNRIGGGLGRMTAHYEWHADDIEYETSPMLGCSWSEETATSHRVVKPLNRLKRLGGFEFSTTDNAATKDKFSMPTVTAKGMPRKYNVPLGSIWAFTQNGRRKVVTQDNYREHPSEAADAVLAAKQSRDFLLKVLGSPKDAREPTKLTAPRKPLPVAPVTGPIPPVTVCPPGLPLGAADLSKLFMGIGSIKGGAKAAVRRPVDIGHAIWDAKADETAIERFRACNDNHAKVLDACMVAASLTDIAAVVGKQSPHTGARKLMSACEALDLFLTENAA